MQRIALLLIPLLMTAPLASAAEKIGFVNQERILRESGPAKRSQAKLDK